MDSITIGMPVYNGAKYLDAALDNLLKQTYVNITILISDNASTDNTQEIILAHSKKDPRIIYYRQLENIGITANFEWLLCNSKDTWFMFAAYDDNWSLNYVEDLLKAITEKPFLKLSVASTLIQDGGVERRYTFDFPSDEKSHLEKARLLIETVRSGWLYGISNREFMLKCWTNAQRSKYAWGNDFLVLLPFLLSGKITGDNNAVYYRRLTGLSENRYKPIFLNKKISLYATSLCEGLRILYLSNFSLSEKLILMPAIFKYIDHHAWSFRSLLKEAIPFKKNIKNFVSKFRTVP